MLQIILTYCKNNGEKIQGYQVNLTDLIHVNVIRQGHEYCIGYSSKEWSKFMQDKQHSVLVTTAKGTSSSAAIWFQLSDAKENHRKLQFVPSLDNLFKVSGQSFLGVAMIYLHSCI